jgi:hypothetical protein
MTASLDHMIVFARDRDASAAYLAEMLERVIKPTGYPEAVR